MASVKSVQEYWKGEVVCGLLAVADDPGNWVLHCCSLSVHPVSLSWSPLKPGEQQTQQQCCVFTDAEVFVAMGWVLLVFLGGTFLWPGCLL